jgi:hypothetical protein
MPDEPPDRKTTARKPLPQCKAFLTCEDVEVDDVTGQFDLSRLVNLLRFPQFPAYVPPSVAFLELYDGIGRYELSAQLRDLAGGTSVAAEAFTTVDFPERLVKMDLALPIAFLRLPRAARYEIAVSLDARELATQLIDAEVADDRQT